MKKSHQQQVLEDMQKIDFSKEHKHSPKLKIFFGIGGLLTIFLMVSLFVVSHPIGPILEGQIASTKLTDNRLELGDMTIYFTSSAAAKLHQLYLQEQQVEFSACLLGQKENDEYYIHMLYQPKMYEQTFNHVSFEPCSQETLIMLHTHPYKSCVASNTDLETLKKSKQRNEDVLMVIMCEPDRFSVYG